MKFLNHGSDVRIERPGERDVYLERNFAAVPAWPHWHVVDAEGVIVAVCDTDYCAEFVASALNRWAPETEPGWPVVCPKCGAVDRRCVPGCPLDDSP
jgi:hypothetical protein